MFVKFINFNIIIILLFLVNFYIIYGMVFKFYFYWIRIIVVFFKVIIWNLKYYDYYKIWSL